METLKTLVLLFLMCLTLQNDDKVKVFGEPVEDIPDFEFDDAFRAPTQQHHFKPQSQSQSFALDDFDEFFIDDNEDGVSEPEYDIATKEKMIHRTLFKALSSKELKYKFSEVLPLLRNLNKQQRLVFASIISAQLSNKGKRMSLDEVKNMFGDTNMKPLLLPIVYDLANLVHEGFLKSDKYQEHEKGDPNQYLRRSFVVSPTKSTSKPKTEQRVVREMDFSAPYSSLKDETFHVDIDDEPKIREIGESLESIKPQPLMQVLNSSFKSATERSSALTYRLPKFESTTSKDHISMEQYENRALSELNGTLSETFVADGNGTLLSPQPLTKRFKKNHPKVPGPSPEKCERFTGGICIETKDYPMSEIIGSIKRHRYAMEALLAEYRDKTAELEQIDYLGDPTADLSDLRRRRQGDESQGSPGSMCSSIIRYARPQKARSATGEWKYIVNTGEHTQTLRLEKCSQPLEPCSYLTENFESSCTQVYNYHRLLSWDNERGLHVDIFKVPTCCSCHLVGYKEAFPPLAQPSNSISASTNQRKIPNNFDSFSSSSNKNTHYSTLGGDDDFEEEDDSNIAYQFGNGFQRVKPKREKEKNSRRRNPSFPDTFLTPPQNGQSLVPFSNRPRQRTPTIKRKQFDQSVADSDLNIARVTVSPPKFSQADKPRKVTPSISSTVDTKVNIRLPNAANNDRKRINYNYHPIIDFFEDEDEEQPKRKNVERKTGKFADQAEETWRPMVGG